MAKKINPVIYTGSILGNCPKCGGEYWGDLDFSVSPPKKLFVKMACAYCHHIGSYFVKKEDLTPSIALRHVSNGQLVSNRRKAKSMKKKKRNFDGVLKGQLSFDQMKAYSKHLEDHNNAVLKK